MSTILKNRWFLIVFVLAAFALTAADLMPPVGGKGGAAGIAPVREAQAKSMYTNGVSITSYEQGDTTFLRGSFEIMEEGGRAVVGASVFVRWTLPDGTKITNLVMTDKNGFGFANTLAMATGKYTFEILRVFKEGYQFGPCLSSHRADFWL